MGTPDFAVASLKALVEADFNIVGVVTSADKPAGRGQKLHQSAVKKYALEKNLNILQPTNLKAPEFIDELTNLKIDLNVIVAFRMLPENVWNMPKLGSINLHGSLLPQYRGAAPINWAIINGEKETGVSTFFLKHEIDTGDILFQEKLSIGVNDTAGQIHDRLMETGAILMVKTLETILSNKYKEIPQHQLIQEELKHAPKIFKADCKINWQNDGIAIHNLIRGLSPYPTAWSEFLKHDNEIITFKLFNTVFEKNMHQLSIGTLISDAKNELKIAVSGGFIHILELQIAGKKRIAIQEFLRGIQQISDYKINV
jgi:methionyl-tRNA formyltransferase